MRLVASVFLGVLALAACSRDPVVPLVQLTELAPKQVELGDKLEIGGAAFPQGRKARVLFEGTLHRPGEPAETDVEIEGEGVVVSPDRIEVPVTEPLLSAFCGAGSSAAHTTWGGVVTVVFAAQTAGAPPVSGTLDQASLDVLPTSSGQARFQANSEDGAKLLTAAGLHVESRAGGGLAVTHVAEGSRAMQAGLLPDDVIVAAGGVRALGVADLAPAPDLRTLALAVRRGGSASEELHELTVDESARTTPRRFALPAAMVGAMALLIALLSASPGTRLAWLRRRLQQTRGPRAQKFDVVAGALGATIALVLPLILPSADLGLLALTAWSGALATSLLVGTEHTRSSWRAAAVTASRVAPAAIACIGALSILGSLRADEVVAAQGPAPWGFFATRSPAHLLLAAVFCSFATLRETSLESDLAAARIPSESIGRAVERLVAFLNAALAVAIFFGGWRLPFVAVHAHGVGAVLCALLFVAKTWALVFVGDRLAAALHARPLVRVAHIAWLRLVPLAVVASFAAAMWESHVTARGTAAATTFAICVAAVAIALQLLWPRRHRVSVDPLV